MPLSHICAAGATSNNDHLVRILSALESNLRHLSQCAPGAQDFERYEREAHQLFTAAERAVLDGVMAPMRDGARQAKRAAARAAGRATKGPTGFREVGCGTVSCYNTKRETLSTLRFGRMPEAGKATLKETLSAEVEAVLEQRPDLRVVKLADAARDNWSFLGQLAPQAASSEELVDFFHAAEHLKAATDAAYGKNNALRSVFEGRPMILPASCQLRRLNSYDFFPIPRGRHAAELVPWRQVLRQHGMPRGRPT